MREETTPQPLRVGDLVRITVEIGTNPVGRPGIVYEEFVTETGTGVSVLLENGHDIGGFFPEEAAEYLAYVASTGLTYTYQSPQKLQDDYRRGLFDEVLARLRTPAE